MNILFPSRLFLLILALLAGAGCTQRRPAGEYQPFDAGKTVDAHLTVVLDLSGSFHAQLSRDGKVMTHLMRVIGTFFDASAGTERNDRLLIAFIAADRQAIFFEGTPRQFQQTYASPDDLRRALFARADPSGSRVFETIADAVEHALTGDGVVPGKTRLSMLVLSDLVDNQSNSQTANRFQRSLQSYAKAGGAVGIHWLPQDAVGPWRDFLAKAGFTARQMRVTAGFHPEAPLPNF